MDKKPFPAPLDKMPPHGGIITPPPKRYPQTYRKKTSKAPTATSIAEIEDSHHQMNTSAKVVQLKNRKKKSIPLRQIVLMGNVTNAIIFSNQENALPICAGGELISGLGPPNILMFPFLFRYKIKIILEGLSNFQRPPNHSPIKTTFTSRIAATQLLFTTAFHDQAPRKLQPHRARPAPQQVDIENTDFILKKVFSHEGICLNFQLPYRNRNYTTNYYNVVIKLENSRSLRALLTTKRSISTCSVLQPIRASSTLR
ncbi:hypothetical protein CDAR_261501 [Caerostris darwini]|uniref:Uncharacterized protein n=1 Tax=Caerostris darwini TaxID=1538125 RepID=A0AAV4SWB3_9ARAC|nr:hypothetical protein CDAR_261501 [Caerostris darwini]